MKLTAVFIFIFTIICSLCSFEQNTITTNNLTQTSFCAGGNIIVQYSTTGTFPLGCTFNAELSDALGSFSNPVVVGSMPFNTGVIAGTIPSNTTFGFNYRVRVVSTNPVVVGSESTTPIVITSTAISATIIATPSNEACQGDSISLWVTYNAAYYWSTGETTQTIHVGQTGIYTVTVTNYITGCEVTSNPKIITIHPTPPVNFGPDIELCDGQNLTLDAGSGYTSYLWNDGATLQTMFVDSNGTYSVAVQDDFGCIGGDTINAIFHPNPIVDIGPDTSLCGSSFLISAGQGFANYNWNNGLSLNATFLADSSGTYFVSVTDSHGCSDSDTIAVNLNPFPIIELGNDLSACGNSITLDAGQGYATYDWNNGSNSSRFFTVNSTGTYYVMVTNQFGCINSDTVNVTINSLPDIALGSSFQILEIDSIILDAGPEYISYQWSTGETSESIILHGWDYPLGDLPISVTVTDSNGCSNVNDIVVSIIQVGVNDNFGIYPNPFNDVLHIVSNQDLFEAQPFFFDMLGKKINPEYIVHSTTMSIKRGNLSSGCYFLFIQSKDGNHSVGKFIID